MAKRFTDTEKWKRPWFRALGLHAKVLWQYMCDECDHAGIFIADFELISFQVGFKVDEQKLAGWLGEKLVKVSADKYFIPSYLEFQYGEKDTKFRAKQSAYDRLAGYGLIDSDGHLKDLTNSYLSVHKDSLESIGIGKDKGKGKSLKGSAEGEYTPEFEKCWAIYPRKDDKGDAFRAYQANVAADEHDKAHSSVLAYRAKLKRDGTAPKFYKLGATFFNKRRWFDVLNAAPPEDLSGNGTDDLDSMVFTRPGGAA